MADVRPESERIELVLRRDGFEATREWVERTVGIYKAALAEHGGYGSDPSYRPRLERAVREFEEWLEISRGRHAFEGAEHALRPQVQDA